MIMPRFFFFFWRIVPPFVWFLLYCRFCYYYPLLPPFSYYRLFLSLRCFLVFLIPLLLFFFTSGVISLPEPMILFVAFRFYHLYSSSPPPPPPSALVHSFFPCLRSSIAQLACVMPVYGLCNMPFLYLWFISSDLLIHHPDQRPLLGSGENWGQSVQLTDGILLLGFKSKIRYKIRSPPPPNSAFLWSGSYVLPNCRARNCCRRYKSLNCHLFQAKFLDSVNPSH